MPVMCPKSKLIIDVTEKFRRLAQAPIVEAVIEIRARAESSWEESLVLARLKAELPDYPLFRSKREVRQEFRLKGSEPAEQTIEDMGWHGLQFESADKLHVAQFLKDRFVFSRLHPYDHWEQFRGEALRLWQIHKTPAQPAEVHRLGVRFINRLLLPENFHINDYLQTTPQAPTDMELLFSGFFHHETWGVPGYPYMINIIKTIQPVQEPPAGGTGLIFDIDVATTQPLELRDELINQYLEEMRWLKNKVFYGNMTEKALEGMR